MEKTYSYGNVEVIVIDNADEEVRRKQLEQAVINFYKQIYKEKQNDKQTIRKANIQEISRN